MNTPNIQIGTAGFNNGYWKGIFYPDNLPKSKWFAYYCQQFPMYELNGTFYKFPTTKILQNWYNRCPDGFKFVTKAPRTITHFKKFVDCKTEIDEFYVACKQGLAEKLYGVLFQLPPSFNYTPERLLMIVSSLSPDFLNIIEFRHASWWNPEVYTAFEKNNLVFCSVSYPNLPEIIIKTYAIGYMRLHGCPKLFYSGYSDEELKNIYDEILSKGFEKFTVCFNNTASEHGILNAVTMKNQSQ